MTKTLSLTVSERMAAVKILNEYKGSLTGLSVLLDDVKKFVISDKEWAQAELVKTPSADGQSETWSWKDEKAQPKTIVAGAETIDFLNDYLKKGDEEKKFTLADTALISLAGKLK